MKHLLSIEELSAAEISSLIASAQSLKAERGNHSSQPLAGQTWAMIFTKSSTRTRVSFEVGIRELGGFPMFLSGNEIQLGRGEPIKDTGCLEEWFTA
jgi:ornithine carbamoyltransferase